MATYVFSDVHGHAAPLERLLERVQPGEDDRVYCLGDMIDRGPDPVGVIRAVRAIPNVTVLLGNHEDLMLSSLDHPLDPFAEFDWTRNGGKTTRRGLKELSHDEREELVAWVRQLPRWASVRVGERLFLLVHAGVDLSVPTPAEWTDETLAAYMRAQDPDQLVWIRDDFWGAPRGLLGEDGRGPIVVAGHTPTPYMGTYTLAASPDRPGRNDEGLGQMVRVGAASDRWNIDAGAAGGHGFGRLLMLRLDDEEETYEDIREGE